MCVDAAMQDMHNDIQEALGQNYALPEDVDEDDLMGELDALEDELASEPTSGTSVPSYLQVSIRLAVEPQTG